MKKIAAIFLIFCMILPMTGFGCGFNGDFHKLGAIFGKNP